MLTALLGGRVLSIVGAESSITRAYWESGILWGIGAAVVLGSALWLARVRSPELALVLGMFFFGYVTIFSQIDYLDDSRDYLYRHIHEEASHSWPRQWESLSRRELYFAFVNHQVTPTGLFWLDHLRAQADIGVLSWEQQGHRRYGGRKGAEVYRQGFWMWWGWLCSYLFLLVGCFFGLFGAALVESKEPPKQPMPEESLGELREALKSKGLSESEISYILTRPQAAEIKIESDEIDVVLPAGDSKLAQLISSDLKLARSWQSTLRIPREPGDDRIEHLVEIKSRFYSHNTDTRWFPYHLVMLAAYRLHHNRPGSRFIESLQAVSSIARFHDVHISVEGFNSPDFSGLEYEHVICGVAWQPLYGRGKKILRRQYGMGRTRTTIARRDSPGCTPCHPVSVLYATGPESS